MMINNHNNFAISLSAPTSVDITITQKCNHKCIHCYNTWRNDNDSTNDNLAKSLTDEQISTLTKELLDNNVWRATLTGGEPLADIEALYPLIESLQNNKIELGLNSNLSLMTDDIAKTLIDTYNWNTIILTSLPGLTPKICDNITQVKGSYQRILNGIDVCNKYDIPVGVNIVISKENLDQLENVFELLNYHKISYLSITRAIPPLYDRDNPNFFLSEKEIIYLADLLEEIHDRYNIPVGSVTPFPLCVIKDINRYKDIFSASCAAGITRCSIDAVTGEVSACTHEARSYGNIYKDGLQTAWKNMYEWREGLLINDKCKDCHYLSFCGGECRMIAQNENHVKYIIDNQVDIKYEPYLPQNPVADDTHFLVSKDVRYRPEKFGGVLRCDNNECYVNNSIIQIYNYINQFDTISVDDLLNICEKNRYFYDMIAEFEKMGILKRIET